MSDLISRLCPAHAAAVQEFELWRQQDFASYAVSGEGDAVLFHYTNAQGLSGIVNNEELWLTSVHHLNDPSELTYGLKSAYGVLEAETTGRGTAVRAFASALEALLNEELQSLITFYVVSFSTAGNDLGQWRAYADDGRGFAIGLPKAIITGELGSNGHPDNALYAKVSYEKGELERRQTEAIRTAVRLIERECPNEASAEDSQDLLRAIVQKASSPLIFNSLTTKHSAYEHESEVRLISLTMAENATSVRTRVRGSKIVPYIQRPISLWPGAIDRVMIGPAAGQETEQGVKALLASKGHVSTFVGRSDIPYRTP